MKCPKCGYLGFEEVTRCRNCGHDFTVEAATPPELPLRTGVATGDSFAPEDLPLFGHTEPTADPLPVLSKVTPPRPPLVVRRATPEVPRVRTEPVRTPMLDLEPPEESPAHIEAEPDRPAEQAARFQQPILLTDTEPAGLLARAVAAAIDLTVIGVVDAIVIYFTLKICGLTLDDLSLLPKAPLLAFLALQNGGYLAAFTAGGQTLGKMSAGIRVVSVDGPPLDLGRSLKRTVLWALLAIPAGLGFATALFDADRRGLHDRLAGTRVVRAGAA